MKPVSCERKFKMDDTGSKNPPSDDEGFGFIG
jgi:hypothetical protein